MDQYTYSRQNCFLSITADYLEKLEVYEMKKISIYEIDDPSDIGEFKKILTIYPKLKWKK